MPPVRLDPFQNITNVGWGGRRLGMLEWGMETGGPGLMAVRPLAPGGAIPEFYLNGGNISLNGLLDPNARFYPPEIEEDDAWMFNGGQSFNSGGVGRGRLYFDTQRLIDNLFPEAEPAEELLIGLQVFVYQETTPDNPMQLTWKFFPSGTPLLVVPIPGIPDATWLEPESPEDEAKTWQVTVIPAFLELSSPGTITLDLRTGIATTPA